MTPKKLIKRGLVVGALGLSVLGTMPAAAALASEDAVHVDLSNDGALELLGSPALVKCSTSAATAALPSEEGFALTAQELEFGECTATKFGVTFPATVQDNGCCRRRLNTDPLSPV